jgi:Tfp pilus assembly protein PilX
MFLTARSMKDERGTAMVLVVFLTAAIALFSVSLIDLVRGDSSRAATATVSDAAFQAAEAGLDDYTSKLLDDNQYFFHDVAVGESTRRASDGTLVAPGASSPTAWTFGTTWTYPNGKDKWRSLTNGYEYNLQVTGPTSTAAYTDIIATGRKQGTTSPVRVIEKWLRPASIADFLMITNSDYTVGSGATTYGKIYAGIDSSGTAHNVTHNGTAYADIYAEGQVNGSVTMMNGAKQYDSNSTPQIRTMLKQPISFTRFSTSLVDIQRAAQLSGIYLNNAAVNAWRLSFLSNGTVDVYRCSGTNETSSSAPTCSTHESGFPKAVPANGAIYVEQSVVVSGGTSTCTDPDGTVLTNANCVNGRVTVASNGDVVVGDDIGWVQSGDDVLGLIGKNDVVVAQWAPDTLHWRAGVLAQTGARHSASSDGSHDTATFTGSQASNGSAFMDMYQTRYYNYDPTLLYLSPPWFPTVDYAYTTLLFRELPGS